LQRGDRRGKKTRTKGQREALKKKKTLGEEARRTGGNLGCALTKMRSTTETAGRSWGARECRGVKG